MRKEKHWSLFFRLFLGFGTSFILLMTTALVVLYLLLMNGLESEKKSILIDRIEAVDSLLKSPAHGLEEIHRRIEQEWPKRTGERVYVGVLDLKNKVLVESPDFPVDAKTLLKTISLSDTNAHQGLIHEFNSYGLNYVGRYKIEENSIAISAPLFIYAFISKEQTSNFLARFRQISVLVIAICIFASVVIGWQIARQGMRPIHTITQTVGNIGTDNLYERIRLETIPVELHELAIAFNQSLNRIEDSFSRLSRFSADIAHELRTPINNMMGEIEVTLGRERSSSEYLDILLSNLEECGRLNAMVESMLFLARTDR